MRRATPAGHPASGSRSAPLRRRATPPARAVVSPARRASGTAGATRRSAAGPGQHDVERARERVDRAGKPRLERARQGLTAQAGKPPEVGQFVRKSNVDGQRPVVQIRRHRAAGATPAADRRRSESCSAPVADQSTRVARSSDWPSASASAGSAWSIPCSATSRSASTLRCPVADGVMRHRPRPGRPHRQIAARRSSSVASTRKTPRPPPHRRRSRDRRPAA
jgi:hypothetical protein